MNAPESTAQGVPDRVYSVYSVFRTCGYCGADISQKRPQALFCSDQHRAASRNEVVRRRKQSPPSVAAERAGQGEQRNRKHPTTIRPGSKIARILSALAAGASLDRITAAERYADFCLHSTIARIRDFGIDVAKRAEIETGCDGRAVRSFRYSLGLPGRRKAAILLRRAAG